MKHSNKYPLLLLAVPLVAIIATLLALPQPKLHWEKDFLPLASIYMNRTQRSIQLNQNHEQIFSGLVVAITGATSGIGMALAQFFLAKGATVIATGRSESKIMQLKARLADNNEDMQARFVPIIMEMSELDSVARGAELIKKTFEKIDVLICNAGIHYAKSMHAKDYSEGPKTTRGLDVSFTVNYLSHFLLTEKLLPVLLASEKPLLLHISSTYHMASDGRDLESRNGEPPRASRPSKSGIIGFFRDTRAYSNSKLAQVLHARAIQLIMGSSIRAVSVCPAWAATQIGGDSGSLGYHILQKLAYPLHDNGWGVASTLQAIFDYDNTDQDFYANSSISKAGYFLSRLLPSWFGDTGLRMLLTINLANALLLMQKFFPMAGPVRSSVESYDMKLARNLYAWSKEEIKEYL